MTLVMFSDYECPYCKRAEQTLDDLRERHESDVRIVFKHLPLDFHQHARGAARIAEAIREAKGDDAFWRANERLFIMSPDLGPEVLEDLGREFGLDDEAIARALERVAEADAGLATHLRNALRTGTFCAYDPAPGTRVEIRR